MENAVMGKVLVTAKVEHLGDLYDVTKSRLAADQVRAVEVTDALVDTGATMLSLPRRLIDRLGLRHVRNRRVRTSAGYAETGIYEAVRLTIQDRDCTVDVAEVPNDCPMLIGQLPLEGLDFVVDPVSQRLIGNPAHGGEHMLEIF